MQNYVGAEGRIKVKKLEGENIFSGNKVTLNATPLTSDIFLLPPPFTKGAFTEKKIVLDGSNSNIKSFVELLPQRINYDLEVETNPHGNISNWKDFIFDDSRVDISLRLECPATFAVGGLNLRDTQPFSFTNIRNLNRVKSAKLIMDIENGYPFEVGMEITFLGAGFQVLGKADFVGGNTIAPSKTDAFGKAVANSKSQLIISVPRDKVWILQKAENVAIKAMIKSAGGTKQKIYNTYKIKISTNGQFEYEANL